MRIGIDWGGTKIEAIALTDDGEERLRRRVPTPRGDYEGCVRTACGLVQALEAEIGTPATVGFGIPGTLSPATGLVKNANSTWLNGRPLKSDLEAALRREVRVQNDANCLAVSEARDGAAAGAHMVLGVIIGTGCGTGIAIDGVAHAGHHGIAGEMGHVPLPWMTKAEHPGNPCWCGRRGCIETYVSGRGFELDFAATTGREASGPEIVADAAGDGVQARQALARYTDRLARALAMMATLIDPDVIVLGGGMSDVDVLYASLPGRIAENVFSDTWDVPVRRAMHGDSSGVRGAAMLWAD